ncbi:MAG: Holliday junction resolvase RuvX [Sedimenticola sp.]|uniref:Putative pre-16S rRNA nuclease n=1 Tax=Sedimenticola thiotaurini TaxID=1543721 RepID=A0A558DC35_9GAMM|nr:Holliday junction resolvase RuvX [Sedimenticola sp.]TVT58594.1 MAG: Holliday junction resolvase RuvX [Sedimenticola thiotaurini]MCW8881927.1 Holliday junction resolvase RuvX [Sedimenticola sp.]MCW8920726.1 Holliday junction resolvase RuvX [Sedimenticola sp.]MCW8946246.1 Holliday junction resolvase RuvX [Sedimenticola sp.]
MGTLLGFDYGTKKIGIAVGQTLTGTATPLTTLRAIQQKPDWTKISLLIEEWRPEALIVGLPYDMDDAEAEIAPLARRFARQLEGRYRLPVHMTDERLTSQIARQELGRAAKNYEELDAIAAKLILETWLSERQ